MNAWAYGKAALVGFLAGSVLFVAYLAVAPMRLDDQITGAVVAAAAGILISCAVATVGDWAMRRNHLRRRRAQARQWQGKPPL